MPERFSALRAASIDIVATSSSRPGTDFLDRQATLASRQTRATSLAGRR